MKFSSSLRVALVLFALHSTAVCWADEKGYFYTRSDEKGDVVHIHFMGPSKWLALQQAEDSKFHRFDQLRSLTLNQHKLSENEMRYVASLNRISELEIGLLPDEIEVPRGVLKPLQNLKTLESLRVSANGLSDDDFGFLGELDQLQDLAIDGDSKLSDFLIWKLAKLENLKSLKLKGIFTDAAIASLVIHRNLTELYIDSPLMSSRSLKAVSLLPSLKTLNGKSVGRSNGRAAVSEKPSGGPE